MKKIKLIGIILFFLIIFGLLPIETLSNTYCWNLVIISGERAPAYCYYPVYDIKNNKLLIFYNYDNEKKVCAFDTTTNTFSIVISSGMPNIIGFQPVYDSKNNVTLMFGGYADTIDYIGTDKTWAYFYENDTWINMNPAVSPPARGLSNIVYDSNSGKIIIFGGTTKWSEPKTSYNDVWVYDFSQNLWSNVTPSSGSYPQARFGHCMSFDLEANCTLVYGGQTSNTDLIGDLWAFNLGEPSLWTKKSNSVGMDDRTFAAMTYDSSVKKHIIYGGENQQVPYPDWISDTWLYDSSEDSWIELEHCYFSPIARSMSNLVFNSKINKSFLFGGLMWGPAYANDIWTFTYNETCDCFIPIGTEIHKNLLLTSIPLVSFMVIIFYRRKKK
jgi:hypothetical protein